MKLWKLWKWHEIVEISMTEGLPDCICGWDVAFIQNLNSGMLRARKGRRPSTIRDLAAKSLLFSTISTISIISLKLWKLWKNCLTFEIVDWNRSLASYGRAGILFYYVGFSSGVATDHIAMDWSILQPVSKNLLIFHNFHNCLRLEIVEIVEIVEKWAVIMNAPRTGGCSVEEWCRRVRGFVFWTLGSLARHVPPIGCWNTVFSGKESIFHNFHKIHDFHNFMKLWKLWNSLSHSELWIPNEAITQKSIWWFFLLFCVFPRRSGAQKHNLTA